ncbi:putative class 2 holin [Pseudoalteromonas virus vB_PspP-H6/1]|nr:putative class 2 holin [Pseudoalteromonas virus vB_PspP-H6/1]
MTPAAATLAFMLLMCFICYMCAYKTGDKARAQYADLWLKRFTVAAVVVLLIVTFEIEFNNWVGWVPAFFGRG